MRHVTRLTYSMELMATDKRDVQSLEYLNFGEIAPVVPQVGRRVGAKDTLMEVLFVSHHFSSIDRPDHIHQHVTVQGRVVDTEG
jgi:cyanate permease